MQYWHLPKPFKEPLYSGLIALIFCPSVAFATVQSHARKSENIIFYKDISIFKSSLNLEISSSPKYVSMPENVINKRLQKYKEDPRVEPIQLTVIPTDDKIFELAEKISKPGNKLSVANYLRENLEDSEQVPGTELRLVTIDRVAFNLLDADAFESLFAKEHESLTIRTTSLKRDPQAQKNFIEELTPFLTQNQMREIKRKVLAGRPLTVDNDLIPPVTRKMIRRYTAFKGPNCFHAALSFQSPLLPKSNHVNVREEPGYHRSMINYDELWRAVKLYFYEINPDKTDLRYGDMILFFDTPKEQIAEVDFHTLRHAATYLFGGYVFAKGSKSANSPYLIGTLADEWAIWRKFTNDLGVKVFRRSLNHVSNSAPWDPEDWMY